MTPAEFARACDDNAKALRRIPSELRRQLAQRVKPEVAEPLAAEIRSAGRGVYSRRVAATTTTRASADPKIVVGNAKRIASGGATGRQLVFGTEFGGGSRVATVRGDGRRRPHRRRVTRQFVRNREPFVFRTIGANVDTSLDRWAGIVDDVLGKLPFGVTRRG